MFSPLSSLAVVLRRCEQPSSCIHWHCYRFSEDRQTIPGYTIIGTPQILSDRLVLTPPAPGNQRVGLWTSKTSHYKEWTLDVNFRASGGERPGGSFHIWYSAAGASGKAGIESVYTSKPWDGLVLVVDSYGGVCAVAGEWADRGG